MRSKKLVRQKSNSKRLNKFRKSQKLNRKSKSLRQNRKTIKGKRSRSIRRKTMRGGANNFDGNNFAQLLGNEPDEQELVELQLEKQTRFTKKKEMLRYALTLSVLKPLLEDNGTALQTFLANLPEDLSEATQEQIIKLDDLVEVHRSPLFRIGRQVTQNLGTVKFATVSRSEEIHIKKNDHYFFTLNPKIVDTIYQNTYQIKNGHNSFFKERRPEYKKKFTNIFRINE